MKTYTYKGHRFHMTDIICGNNGRNLYEIEGLKEAGHRPFLTSIKACREFIDAYLSDPAAALAYRHF